MAPTENRMLIRNGRVYDHGGDTDLPPTRDILVVGDTISAVAANLPASLGEAQTQARIQVIDAKDKLVLPGFVNAHYHSHDTLLKGCFETIPLECWVLSALPPAYPKRSRDEVIARTLLGAVECIRNGITTVQDMLTIFPFDEDHLEAVLRAYADCGLRTVFALQIGNIPGVERVPYWKEEIPQEFHRQLGAAVEPFQKADSFDIAVGAYGKFRDRHPRITWGLGPTSPEFCSPDLLRRIAAFSETHNLPVFSHINESKSMAVAGHLFMPEHDGSQIEYLRSVGLLGPRLTLAHSVWLTHREIELIAETGTNVALNPVGNLKTKSGVAPIREFLAAGVNVALGCDNCSCSDAQNMFQAMKLFACLPAVCDPEPGPPAAADALRCATSGGARAVGLDGVIGAIQPGMKADLTILDLAHPTFVPLNSAARQAVYSESGASVDTVIIDGRVVFRDGTLLTVNESDLRAAVEEIMPGLRADLDHVRARVAAFYPHLLDAWRRSWQRDIGTHRFLVAPLPRAVGRTKAVAAARSKSTSRRSSRR